MLKKNKGIDRVRIIFRPIQWMWLQRWPLLVIISPVVAASTFYGIHRYLAPERAKNKLGDEFLQEKQIAQVKKDVLQITSQILVGITVLSGAYFTWKRLEVSREDQITDRYTRAIDQLGSEHLEIRLGGIYALERLANDSRKDQETVMKVMTAFVRENASLQKSEITSLSESSDIECDSQVDKDEEKTSEKLNPKTDIQAILTILGRRTWKVIGRINLSKANLRGADLKKANLFEANLFEAKLIGANLTEADLSWADLSWADLFEADLIKADLKRAYLIKTNLSGADLFEADLSEAYLFGANLSWANLTEANLSGADLIGANLFEADLSGASLFEANLRGADLKKAKLSEAKLSGAKIIGADLTEAKLKKADLSGADLFEADLFEADLFGANLSWANLTEANLSGADLSGAREITPDQIKQANNWEQATYSDDFKAQLGSSTAPEESGEKPEEQPPSSN